MKIQNQDDQHNDFKVAALGMRLVKFEEVVDVPPEVAALLLIQPSNWGLPADAVAEDVALRDKFLADHLAELRQASGIEDPSPFVGEAGPELFVPDTAGTIVTPKKKGA